MTTVISFVRGSVRAQRYGRALVIAGLSVLAAGCAATTVDNFPDTSAVMDSADYFERKPVPSLTGYQKAVQKRTAALLAQPLTLSAAVEIAMLNTQKLQHHYQEQKIWGPGLVESLAEATGKEGDPDSSAAAWTAARLALLKPVNAKRRYDFADEYIATAADFIDVAEEVRKSYFEAVAAQQLVSMLEQVARATQAMATLANEQYSAGTANRRSQASQHLAHAEVVKELAHAKQKLVVAREDLNRRLGLWGEFTAWKSPEKLPDLPAERPAFAQLEDFALKNRFEVLAERQSWGLWHTSIEVRSEVRENYAALLTAYDMAKYQQEVVVPLSKTVLEETQKEYNGMLMGVYELLIDTREHIAAGKSYVEELRDFWAAYAELEQAVGGKLPKRSALPKKDTAQ
jgi:hypothetical protein